MPKKMSATFELLGIWQWEMEHVPDIELIDRFYSERTFADQQHLIIGMPLSRFF